MIKIITNLGSIALIIYFINILIYIVYYIYYILLIYINLGSIYDGQWENEKYHGLGVYQQSSGDIYEGNIYYNYLYY